MTEIEVMSAFLGRKPADMLNLKSDGTRLHSRETVIAEWTRHQLRLVSQKGHTGAERSKDVLTYLILRKIQEESLIQRV